MSRETEQNSIEDQIPFDDSEREKIPSEKTPVIQTEKSAELSIIPEKISTAGPSETSSSDDNSESAKKMSLENLSASNDDLIEKTSATVTGEISGKFSPKNLSTSDDNPSELPLINKITLDGLSSEVERFLGKNFPEISPVTVKMTRKRTKTKYTPYEKTHSGKDKFRLIIPEDISTAGPTETFSSNDDSESSKKMSLENEKTPATITEEISGKISPENHSSSDDHSSADDNTTTRQKSTITEEISRKISPENHSSSDDHSSADDNTPTRQKRNKKRYAPYERTSAGEKDLAIPEKISTASPSMENQITEYFPSGKAKPPSAAEKGKRKRENYNLDVNLHKEFNWREAKKNKLDTLSDREAALSQRQSFTTLLSSASLILPPEVDMVLVSRSGYVVEWKQEDSNSQIPSTKVTHALKDDRRETIGDEIHEVSFQIPCSYHNNFTMKEFKERANKEKRHIIQSKVEDTEHSFLQQTTITNNQLKEAAIKKKEITTREKLTNVVSQINESLSYFNYIPAKNVPIRDKQSVSIIFFIFFYIPYQNHNLIC